ncbi:hypothetical protein ZTR_03880 [Talaromyces verruculosus]|nr:hypothetical protein ZTR_03880 [Talaromyces verruculosus]
MVLLIHGSPLSPCTKRVQIVLHEKGIPFEFNPVDLSKGEQKSELHIQKQPFGKVPVLEEDGFVLYESRAICQYVAAKYRNQGTDLFPDNDKVEEFSLLQQGISAELSNFDPVAFGICNEKIFKGEPADESKVAELSTKLKSVLAGYERILVKQKYFTGDNLTLADLFHLPYASLLETLGFGDLFAEFPAFNSAPRSTAMSTRERPHKHTYKRVSTPASTPASTPYTELKPTTPDSLRMLYVCCKRLGLECRWTVPVAGEDYTPPPKRRQTIGRRRERAQNSVANDKVAIASHADDSQASRPREDPDTHAEASRHLEQSGSRLAQTPPFELDAYVDMLGDLPFNTDFALNLDPAVLSFNGEGLGFGPPPTFDSLFSLPAGRSGNSRSLSNCTDPHFPQPPSNSHSHERTSGADASVSWEISNLGADEHHLIQHYLAAMTGYAKVDDYPRASNNLYTTAFSQSLFFKPLLYAILAFSASHLALEDGRYLEKASKYEQLAHDSFEACKGHGAELDSLLCALFVRAKRVHLTAGNIESFHSLIIEATEIILSEKGQQALQDPFSLAQRIVIRLALLDARASCYRLGGGTLIKALRHTPAMSYIFNPESHDRLAPNALVSLLRADILRMKVSEIDLRLRFQTESEELIPLPVRTDELLSLQKHVEHEIRQLEYQMSSRGHDPDDVTQAECVLEPSTYAQYLVMAALHSTILYLYMVYVSFLSLFGVDIQCWHCAE